MEDLEWPQVVYGSIVAVVQGKQGASRIVRFQLCEANRFTAEQDIDVETAWAFSAFTVLIYYALTNLADSGCRAVSVFIRRSSPDSG